MNILRFRLIGLVLFALLSLGQAYPFSVAWAAAGSAHTCCCAAMKDDEAGCRCRHGGKMKCHKETTPSFSPAPCGGPSTDVHALNFSGELCLPRFTSLTFTLGVSDLSHREMEAPLADSPVPEPPPPKA